ncbi:MAG: PAS domain S-box protein [Pseudomonadota bacterium]|nr:PAS domain S-box protein [Pseudomonadota bacterium]
MKSSSSPVPPHPPRRPGAMQVLLHSIDWSGTAMGPREHWPACLRTAVSIVMQARQPMAVAWGPALNVLYNDSYRDLLGARGNRAEETFGQSISVVWPTLAAESMGSMRRAMAGQADYDREMPYLSSRSGISEVVYMNISTSPVCDDESNVHGVFCTIVESTAGVTAQYQRDAALENMVLMSERMRLATELTELGMFEVDLASDEVLIDTSMQRFGVPEGRMPRAEIATRLVHPDHRARVEAFVADFYADPGDGKYATQYRTMDTDDGQERWLAARGRLMFDQDGLPVRMICTVLDISESKREQAAARLSARQELAVVDDNVRYRTFFTQGSHFALLMSTAGEVLEVNQMALESCGFARDDVVGKPLWECGWWHSAPDVVRAVHAGVATAAAGQTVHHKLPYFTADGVALIGQMSIAVPPNLRKPNRS